MEEKRYWFDFCASIVISATSEEVAKERFWDFIDANKLEYTELNHIEKIEKEI